MDSETESALRTAQAPLWERQNWLRKATLESVLEVNEQVLALLRAQCMTGVAAALAAAGGGSFAAESGRQVAALAPPPVRYCWWMRDWPMTGCGRMRSAARSMTASRLFPVPFFTVDGAVAIMRLVMTQAWHLARSEPAAARLLLGVSAANLTVIGGCTLSRLIRLAETRSQWLRPRWESRPKIWCDLLRAAGDGERRGLGADAGPGSAAAGCRRAAGVRCNARSFARTVAQGQRLSGTAPDPV